MDEQNFAPPMPDEELNTFSGEVEVAALHREPVQLIHAEIDYVVSPTGKILFLAVRPEGKEIPLHHVSRTSLLRAYGKHRGIRT